MEPTQECKLYKGCGLSARPRTCARERAPANARPRTRACKHTPANARPHSTFTLHLLSLVACKFTVVGGRGFTGPVLFCQYWMSSSDQNSSAFVSQFMKFAKIGMDRFCLIVPMLLTEESISTFGR